MCHFINATIQELLIGMKNSGGSFGIQVDKTKKANNLYFSFTYLFRMGELYNSLDNAKIA